MDQVIKAVSSDINVGCILLLYFCLTCFGDLEITETWANSIVVELLACEKVVFNLVKSQIALTSTKPPSCIVIHHGLGRTRKGVEEEPRDEEDET